MIAPDLQSLSIFLRLGITDMRKQADGLSIIIEDLMEEDPGSGNLYLFCNREKKLLKCLWWDRNGFWLAQKRLEKELKDALLAVKAKAEEVPETTREAITNKEA